jgi:protein-disulfide isomerase
MQDLLKQEIEQKVSPPTDEEVQAFYDQNKDRSREIRGKSAEEAKPLIAQMMLQRKMMERQMEYINQLREDAKVRMMLEPPRLDVPVPASEPSRGPADAPVTMVEFSDFQCGYCKRVHPTVEQLLAEYGDRIRFVYRDFALAFHPRAVPAAKAARCAGDQGKYWEYHKNLLEQQGDLENADLERRAGELGLDQAAFSACLASDRHDQAIQSGMQDGEAIGVTGTPTFFINGRMLVGLKSKEGFAAIIEEELDRHAGEEKKSPGK